MIRSFFALLFLSIFAVFPSMADTRAVYTITDIAVDEAAPSVIDAQQKAFSAARVIGVRDLFNKITLQVDRTKVGGIVLDSDLAQRLAAAVDVQEESRGGGRYRGVLSIVVNPQLARAHLQTLGIPYIDQQAPLALIAPITSSGQQAEWMSAWGLEEPYALAPYRVAVASYDRNSDWLVLQAEISQTRTNRGVLAEYLSGNRVRLTQVTASGNTVIGTTGYASDMEQAVRRASALLDDSWKQQSIVRTSMRTIRQVEVLYTSLSEWNKLRGALVRSPLISDFQINAIARDGAVITFAYAGEEERLSRDLRQRGVALDNDMSGWIMTSAVIGGR